MAEFPDLGKHCQASFCNKLDFLPFVCSSCEGTFCVDHQNPDSHGCVLPVSQDSSKKPGVALSKPCSLSECSGTELVEVFCGHCHRPFCLQHRHPQDHACPQFLSNQNTAQLSGTQVLNQKYSELTTSVTSTRSKGHKSEATAAKVRLMRLKMKASGEAGVPQEDKVFFQVQMPLRHSTIRREADLYFSKHWAVGKMIDWLAKTEKLVNNNHNPSAEQLRLFADDRPLLPLSTQLSSLVTSGTVFSGGILKLEYFPGQS